MSRLAFLLLGLSLCAGCVDDGPVSGPDVVIAPDSSMFSNLVPDSSDRGTWNDKETVHVDLGDCNYEHALVISSMTRAYYLSHPFVGDRCEMFLGGDFGLGDTSFPQFGQPTTYCVFDRHSGVDLDMTLPVATIADEHARRYCQKIPVVFFPPDCPNCGDGGGGPL